MVAAGFGIPFLLIFTLAVYAGGYRLVLRSQASSGWDGVRFEPPAQFATEDPERSGEEGLQARHQPRPVVRGRAGISVSARDDSSSLPSIGGLKVEQVPRAGVRASVEVLVATPDEGLIECSFVGLYQGEPLTDEVADHMPGAGFRLRGANGPIYSADGPAVQAGFLLWRQM